MNDISQGFTIKILDMVRDELNIPKEMPIFGLELKINNIHMTEVLIKSEIVTKPDPTPIPMGGKKTTVGS